MQLLKYFTTILIASFTMASLFAATPWGKESHLEQARGEVIPYNSDSLLRGECVGRDTTKFVQRIKRWDALPDMGDGERQYISYFLSPYEWLGREVLLHFDYVDAPFTLEVNGQKVGRIENGNIPTEFNVTDFSESGSNTITVTLHDNSAVKAKLESWRKDGEKDVKRIEQRLKGVRAISPSTITMREIYSRNRMGRDSLGVTQLNTEIGVVVKSHMLNKERATVRYQLYNHMGESVTQGSQDRVLEMRQEDTIRIAVNVPMGDVWGAESHNMHTLELSIFYDGVYEEYLSLPLGLRSVTLEGSAILFNGEQLQLKAKRVLPSIERDDVITITEQGANTLVIGAGESAEPLLKICDELGLYAIVTAPVNSSTSGDGRTIGGNPTNDPELRDEYVDRALRCYHTYKRHASLVGLAIAETSSNGYNLYESYIETKRVVDGDIAVIYLDAEGEWNSDSLQLEIIK